MYDLEKLKGNLEEVLGKAETCQEEIDKAITEGKTDEDIKVLQDNMAEFDKEMDGIEGKIAKAEAWAKRRDSLKKIGELAKAKTEPVAPEEDKVDAKAKDLEKEENDKRNIFFDYLQGKSLNSLIRAEQEATEMSLTRAGRPNCKLIFPKLDAFHLGEYFYLLEVACAFAGDLFGIDPFDQPGVEEGKRLTFGIMDREGYENKQKEFLDWRKRKRRAV